MGVDTGAGTVGAGAVVTHRATRQERRATRRLHRLSARVWQPPRHDQWASFGHRSRVAAPARVTMPECIAIGDDVVVLEHVFLSVVSAFPDITPRLVLEDGVRIGRGSAFAVVGEVVVGRGTTIGDFTTVADTYHPYEVVDRMPAVVRPAPVRVGSDVVIGSHVMVLPGVTIGDGAFIDHHAVVTRDVPAGGVVADYLQVREPTAG